MYDGLPFPNKKDPLGHHTLGAWKQINTMNVTSHDADCNQKSRFSPCDRAGRCPPRNGTFPTDRSKLCWGCHDYWRYRDIEEERAQATFRDRERLAPMLKDLHRLVEIFPAETMEAVSPLFDAYILRRSNLVRAYTTRIVKSQVEAMRPEMEQFLGDLLVAREAVTNA